MDAVLDDTANLSGDVARDARWGEWGPRVAADLGVRSVLAYRLLLEASTSRSPASTSTHARADAFDEQALHLGVVLATHGSLLMSAVMARDVAANLAGTLQANREVGVAMGVLMYRHRLTRDQAFDLLAPGRPAERAEPGRGRGHRSPTPVTSACSRRRRGGGAGARCAPAPDPPALTGRPRAAGCRAGCRPPGPRTPRHGPRPRPAGHGRVASGTSCAAMIRPTATLLLDASASTRGAVRARAIVVKVRSALVTAPPGPAAVQRGQLLVVPVEGAGRAAVEVQAAVDAARAHQGDRQGAGHPGPCARRGEGLPGALVDRVVGREGDDAALLDGVHAWTALEVLDGVQRARSRGRTPPR